MHVRRTPRGQLGAVEFQQRLVVAQVALGCISCAPARAPSLHPFLLLFLLLLLLHERGGLQRHQHLVSHWETADEPRLLAGVSGPRLIRQSHEVAEHARALGREHAQQHLFTLRGQKSRGI